MSYFGVPARRIEHISPRSVDYSKCDVTKLWKYRLRLRENTVKYEKNNHGNIPQYC